MSGGTDRPTTIEYGVRLTVTAAYGVHRGNSHYSVLYWTPEPTSESEAKELAAEERGVVEVHDEINTCEVPAPEKWGSDEPRLMSDGGTVEAGTEQCSECGEPPKGVTMGPDMDGWSCPYCGHYNKMEGSV